MTGFADALMAVFLLCVFGLTLANIVGWRWKR